MLLLYSLRELKKNSQKVVLPLPEKQEAQMTVLVLQHMYVIVSVFCDKINFMINCQLYRRGHYHLSLYKPHHGTRNMTHVTTLR